jgi:hypothetical protein
LRILESAEKAESTSWELRGRVVLVVQVMIWTERKEVEIDVVGWVLVNVMKVRPVCATYRTAMVVLIEDTLSERLGNGWAARIHGG